MDTFTVRTRIRFATIGAAAIAIGWLSNSGMRTLGAAPPTGFYKQTNLVSDEPGLAPLLDPNLVNPWGIAASATSPFWLADNGSGLSTLYSGDVNGSPFVRSSLVVSVPGGLPTGIVFNGSSDFVVSAGGASGPARFIFASQVGVVSGWNPAVPPQNPPATSTMAQTAFTANAVYTGLAIGQAGGANYLYALDFEHRMIDVLDGTFHLAHLDGSFTDPNVPNSYAPFAIHNLNGNLYVTYAQQSHKAPDEETDRGAGFVSVFDTSGRLLKRLILGRHLKAPWGIALAPADFGRFGGALIVGNFGNGHIQAFDGDNGQFLGELTDAGGRPIVIDGLWAIQFGNGGSGGDKNALYFAAGPDDETHGLFGSLRFVQP